MAYSAFAVANAFIQKANEGYIADLTPMKLQKLLYYTQAWHLKVLKKPVLDDHFARWQFGPVIPAIYHEFKAFGFSKVTRMATTLAMNADGFQMQVPTIPQRDHETWSLIDVIISRYGSFDGQTLSNMTHRQGSAWAKGSPDGSVITANDITEDTTI